MREFAVALGSNSTIQTILLGNQKATPTGNDAESQFAASLLKNEMY
jgi:hypothetical protein